jgi:NAD(P)-dependent dehydrogenase (short-subunit alcohol dehydrogenase family)
MEKLMTDKAGFITGSSSGIGRASAIEFAKEGAKVVVVAGKNLKGAQETVEIIEQNGGIASTYQCDATKEEEIKALVDETIKRYGRLDFAHLNAGITSAGQLIADTDSEEWKKLINVNLFGTYYGLKHTIKAMLKFGRGAIVVTSSVAGFEGGRYQSSYITSKFALNGLIK